jgi:lipopolysaccharide export system protein LptC
MTGERLVAALRHEARRVAAMPARLRRSGVTGIPGRLPGDRYSRRVALLKRVLPAVGLTLLLLVAAWPRLAPLIDIRIPGIDLREARELKMVDPRYAGIDRLNRPYVVTAATGRQVPDRRDLMSLKLPKAHMVLRHGATVTITAATGVYQAQAQLLDLMKNVDLTHQDGTRFLTNSAHVDLANDTAEGHEPVTGHGPTGDISAQGFRILSRGDTVIFTGNSVLRLNGGRPGTVGTAPPSLPVAVDAAAAELAAEATVAPPTPANPTRAVAAAAAASVHANPRVARHTVAESRHDRARHAIRHSRRTGHHAVKRGKEKKAARHDRNAHHRHRQHTRHRSVKVRRGRASKEKRRAQ